MATPFAWLVAAPSLLLLAAGLIPGDWANRNLASMRRLATTITAMAAGLAMLVAIGLAVGTAIDVPLAAVPGLPAINIGVYFDSLAAIMLILISFIGAVICRYSVRYLDGDPQQGRFLCRMLFTLGSVLLLVISRNLLQFTVAWILSSYSERSF
jgi:NAD(P)H-quinone oxidoreductase subunit 5